MVVLGVGRGVPGEECVWKEWGGELGIDGGAGGPPPPWAEMMEGS